MKTIEELEMFFYTDLQNNLQKVQKLAESTSKKIKLLNIMYSLIYLIVNIYYIYICHDLLYVLYFIVNPIILYLLFTYLYHRILFIYLFLIMFFSYQIDLFSFFIIGIIINIPILLVSIFHKNISETEYILKYHQWIVKPLLSSFNPNFIYTLYGSIPKHYVKDSWLFDKAQIYLAAKEKIKGKYLDIPFEIANVDASDTRIDAYGREESGTSFFYGTVFACKFQKKLKYRTVVFPNNNKRRYRNLISNWLQKKNTNNMKLIKLNYPEFEKKFKVYGENEQETSYILNHNLLIKILQLTECLGNQDIMFSFHLNNFIIFSYNTYSFTAPSAKNLQDFAHIKYNLETIHCNIGIIEALHLNKKLWINEDVI